MAGYRPASPVGRRAARDSPAGCGPVTVEQLLAELRDTLHGIHLLRHCPLQALDMAASFGERLSALIIAAHLEAHHPAVFVDARQFVVTDDQFTQATVISADQPCGLGRASRSCLRRASARTRSRW